MNHLTEHPVPDEYLKYIGDITVSFSLLESTIQWIAFTLIGDSQRIGQIITAELSYKKLIALVINLYIERYKKDEDYLLLKELMNKASIIEDRRNQITHSIWTVGRKPDSVLRIKTTAKEKHGLQFQFEDIDTKTLSEYVNNIKELITEITLFVICFIEKENK